MIIKIFVTLFVFFALSRVYLRFKEGSIRTVAMVIWLFIWGAIIFFVWWPRFSTSLAEQVGVGRGVDALVYISIVTLFYGVFRIYIKLEHIEHEITCLVRNIALKSNKSSNNHDEQTPRRTN